MSTFLALDVGDKRIGVAIASDAAQIAQPLATLENNELFWVKLQTIIKHESVHTLIVGLPRSLNGKETVQTLKARVFAKKLKNMTAVAVYLQDEAGTSLQAKAELNRGGQPYDKAKIDAQAASIILHDYLTQHIEVPS